jgi:hypothetical protein
MASPFRTRQCRRSAAWECAHLRDRLPVDIAAERLDRFFRASVELMQVLARACGHTSLDQFEPRDLTTWKREMADLTGIQYGGVGG